MNDIKKDMTCICCPIGCQLHVEKQNDGSYLVTGNKCPRGKSYGVEEMTAPKRFVTTTVRINGWMYPVISVKTKTGIPKEMIFDVMNALSDVVVKVPVHIGDVVVEDVCSTGVDVVITRNAEEFIG